MDESKKPGPRDISDLKARLGLKKTAASMPAASAGQPSPGQGPPPPFGRPAEAPPVAPSPPDPRRDPFAAQQQANLAAFYGIGQTLPGSGENVSAEPLSQPKALGRIAVIAAACAAGLVAGIATGTIYAGRGEYNRTIDQAGQIRDQVDKMARQLGTIADTINQSKASSQNNIDIEMTAKLGALDLKKPDTVKIFHTNYSHLEDVAVERLFTYYDHTIRLYDEINAHAKKTENDKDALERYLQSGGGKSEKNYGVTIEQQGGLTLAHFVEVGSPVCNDPNKTDCNTNELKGFKYRLDSGSAWGERPIKGKPNDIVMPIQQTPLFKGVAAGNPDFLAVKDYSRRIGSIRSLAQSLVVEQKDVIGDLKRAAERPRLFNF